MSLPLRTHGPAMNVKVAAQYQGWPLRTLQNDWRKHPMLVRAALKDGRRLTFLQSGLDAYLDSCRVVRGTDARVSR
jgi:hypothetical protein